MDGMSEMMGLGIQFVFTWGHLHSEIGALWIVFFAAFLLFGFALVLDCVLCISLVSVGAFGYRRRLDRRFVPLSACR